MEQLYRITQETISKCMTAPVSPHHLSKEHAESLLNFTASVNLSKGICISGSETHVNASKNEDMCIVLVLTQNKFQELQKSQKSSSSTITVTVFKEDYFGYERSVKHSYSCTFEKPSQDGLYYIRQPCGSQSSPDFLTIHIKGGKVVSTFALEYKGSKSKEKWNAHIQSFSRSIMYVIQRKDKVYCLFGDQIRTKESLLHALTHDELLRDLVEFSNKNNGCNNKNTARPGHEFSVLDLDSKYESNSANIKSYFNSFII